MEDVENKKSLPLVNSHLLVFGLNFGASARIGCFFFRTES